MFICKRHAFVLQTTVFITPVFITSVFAQSLDRRYKHSLLYIQRWCNPECRLRITMRNDVCQLSLSVMKAEVIWHCLAFAQICTCTTCWKRNTCVSELSMQVYEAKAKAFNDLNKGHAIVLSREWTGRSKTAAGRRTGEKGVGTNRSENLHKKVNIFHL